MLNFFKLEARAGWIQGSAVLFNCLLVFGQVTNTRGVLWWSFSALMVLANVLLLSDIRWRRVNRDILVWRFKKVRPIRDPRNPHLFFDRGYEIGYDRMFFQRRPFQERIERAATRDLNGIIYTVGIPGRHGDIQSAMYAVKQSDTERDGNTADQGFLTSHGRYVGRHRAFDIATAAKQILIKHSPLDELCSEDVWD